MLWWTCLAVLCFAAAESRDKGEWKEVHIKQGPVRGYRDSSGELWTFHNIPYATAPTDKHKFKAPLPPPTWTEPFEAVDKGIICPQFKTMFLPKSATLQEHCLLANVYMPDTEENNLSVLVQVHGGAFQIGFGDMLKVKNLMKRKDIIVVNFNYRVGIHGFLCLGTEDIPGNAGMKDQVALLRWVQQNIAVFGGNPNDVTIEGYSAGSAAVDLLMISKAAEGLFHKVIPESGSSLAAFTVQPDPIQTAKNHARKLGLTNLNTISALEEFYQTLPYETLTADVFLTNTDSTFTFSPCVEDDTGDGAFLTESPFTILKTGGYRKVPLLYGFANMEGLMQVNFFDAMFKDKMNEKFSDFLPADLKFESEAEKEAVARKIKDYFFGDKPVSGENILSFVDFFSDTFFAHSTLWAVKLHVEAGHDQVYLYEYSFVDEDTPVVPHTNVRGATHCAQSMAVADGKNLTYFEEDNLSEEYSNMKKIIREIWHNFIITGEPIPEGSSLPAWPAVGVGRSPHMSLGQKLELRGELLPERFRFWQNIYQKYYKEPKSPSRGGRVFLCGTVAADSKYDKGEWKEVKIKQGPVRGYKDSRGELWTFYNIPYATAPTDKHKFKAPLPPPTWTEPYDAIDKGVICPQIHNYLVSESSALQENCLIANIYVPDTKKKNLSVLVYVHGGGFLAGFGEMARLKNIMRYNDFIVVNFNYRLSIHGFLCLGTENVPGNAGMKDQVALLRWVQENIAAFGGNPNDVTLAGSSAGAASVDLLMISKVAEGLFHRVIPESGASLAAFTVQTDPLQIAKDHAKKLGFNNVDDIFALEEFYQSLSYETLTSDGFLANTDSTFTFSPCVEHDTGDGAFLTQSPLKILKTGNYKKVPLLNGFADMEGLMRIDYFDLMWKDKMNEKFSDFLPADLKFESEAERETVATKIKEFYFGDKPVSEENILGYIDFFSDVFFTHSTLWTIKLHIEAGHDQVYLYEYSFVDENTPVVPHTNIRGANHCAQTIALCDGKNFTSSDEDSITEEFKNMKKIIREIWHNFIITGEPVPKGSSLPAWPALGADRSPYMSLGQKVELRSSPLLSERFSFWQDIYNSYYQEPIPPSHILTKQHTEL